MKMIFVLFLFLMHEVSANGRASTDGQVPPTECQAAPHWTTNGRDVMRETHGNVTLVALMELHCSFCRSQIEGFVALSKMLKNQSVHEVQFVIVAPWNESAQYVEYFRRYLDPHGIKVVQETNDEPIWSKMKGNKDDFYIYDACGRLSYYIPYPQSYLYYHYTISTLYATLRQEKCGPCKLITTLKVRAYLNVAPGNTTTHVFETEVTARPHQIPTPPSQMTSPRPEPRTRKPPRRPRGRKTTTPSMPDLDMTTTVVTAKTPFPTPVLISVTSGEESEIEAMTPMPSSTTQSPRIPSENTAQIPVSTIGTVAGTDATPTDIDYIEEYEDASDADHRYNGGGAVGSVGASVVNRRIIRKRTNRTTTTTSTVPTTRTTPRRPTTTTKPHTTSWSIDPKARFTTSTVMVTTEGSTRIPKLGHDKSAECFKYPADSCYRQWQESGTLHACCRRGVYLTDMCKKPLCNNATLPLCCFQKYQQARFQCCNDDDLSADRPDDFSKCCYNHFIAEEDESDHCCPKSIARYFWTTQTRVAELCLPNVELDLDGLVLEARMTDSTPVRIPLQESTALQYDCPYVDRRLDFFYWEPDGSEQEMAKTTTTTLSDVEMTE